MRRPVPAGSTGGDVAGHDQLRPQAPRVFERISAALTAPLAMAVEISAIAVPPSVE
jgi:hypothetical protein